MASSYGYVKREVQDMQINWAEVGQNVRSVLDEESRVRQEKKDAFDKQAREYEQRVTNPDLLGKDTEFNEGVLKFGADAQEMSMMNSTLLKSGQLKPRDYTIRTQNMIDGTNDVFKVIEMYNNLSEEVMAGVDSGDLSSDMLDNFAMVQDFANFNDNSILFNPYSGKVNVATMVEDPDNPGGPLIPSKDLRSVQSLGNILKDQVAKYKFFDKTTEYANKLGIIVEQSITSYGGTYQKGTIEKLTNVFLKRPGALEELSSDEKKKIAADLGIDENEVMMIHSAIGTWAESQIVSKRDGMSILVDFLGTTPDGERYKAVFNEEDAFDDNGNRKENIILKRVENGRLIYELTDEQKIAAKKTLVRQLSSELTANTEIVAEQIFDEPSVAKEEKDRLDNERKERSTDFRNMMSQIYYGDATEVAASETYFRDLLRATEVKKQGNIILVKKYNEDTKRMQTTPITMLGEDGKLMSFDMFAKSAITGLVGEADIDKAVVLGGSMQMGVVKSVTLDKAPELQEDGTLTRGKVKVTFESGREEILEGGLGDYKVGSERELTSITPTGKGAGTIVSESDSAYKGRYIDGVVNVPKLKTLTKSDTVEDLSPTDVVSHLSVLTGLGFEVEDAPIQPNRVLVTAADGTVYKFETNKDTLDEQIKGLITFINTNMLDAKYDAADKKSVIGPKKEGTEIEGTTEADNLLNE
tara:strand:- start:486 stop:2576 length:2091 start_codon:yes stop_codon:yes gene_type:complete